MASYNLMYAGSPSTACSIRAAGAKEAAIEFFKRTPSSRSIIVNWGLFSEKVFSPEALGFDVEAYRIEEAKQEEFQKAQREEPPLFYEVAQTDLPILNLLTRHFKWASGISSIKFYGLLWLEHTLCISVAVLLSVVLDIPPRTSLNGHSDLELFIGAVIFAPLVETFIIQVLLGELARALKLKFWWQVCIMAVGFMLAHTFEGIGTVICAGIVGGFFFSYAYAVKRNKSFGSAYLSAALLHFLANSSIMIAVAILRRF